MTSSTGSSSEQLSMPAMVGTQVSGHDSELAGFWYIDYDFPLGSGHFGDVYLCENRVGVKAACKLSRTPISSSEINALRLMGGKGAPELFFHGRSGGYYVLVMQLLGSSLYSLASSRCDNPTRKEPWTFNASELRFIGLECVDVLERLHSFGYIHGDVKPANFCIARPNGSLYDGIKLVDLGLSKCITKNNQHVPYSQDVAHFAGSLRYASINVHHGRTITRRDDLESLAYMLLYLFIGRLPWQGERGDDKGDRIANKKGLMSLRETCTGAPVGLQLFLENVRKLRFEESPDYNYLRSLLDFTMQPIVTSVYEVPASPLQAPAIAGAIRKKRIQRSPGHEGLVTNGMNVLADLKRCKFQPQSSTSGMSWVITAETRSWDFGTIEDQVIITMRNLKSMSKHSVKNMIESENWFITAISWDGDGIRTLFSCVTDPKSCVYGRQEVLRANSDNEFRKQVEFWWDEGYYITAVDGCKEKNQWVFVMSELRDPNQFAVKQSFIISRTFPRRWLSDQWVDYSYITALGADAHSWCVVVTKSGAVRMTDQCVEFGFTYPSEAIRQRWDGSFFITSVRSNREVTAYVMSRICGGNSCVNVPYDAQQRTIRTLSEPGIKAKSEAIDGYAIRDFTFGPA